MFNLSDYETVEDRLAKFWKEHPDGRIETELLEANANRFIVLARIFRTEADAKHWTSGLAEETVSARGVNQTSALENCETSAIGRALANAGYAAKGKRASREEMAKVVNNSKPSNPTRKSDGIINVENPSDPWTTQPKPEPKLMATDMVQAAFQNAEAIPNCKHGPMRVKEGTKNNRSYHGYICPNSGGITDVCEAIWYKLSPSGKWMPPTPKE